MLLGATAVAHFANAAGLLDEAHALVWRATAMVVELVQPTALLYVGLAFMNPVGRSSDTSALWRARVVGCVGVFLAGFVATGQIFEWKVFEDGQAAIALTHPLCLYCDRHGSGAGAAGVSLARQP